MLIVPMYHSSKHSISNSSSNSSVAVCSSSLIRTWYVAAVETSNGTGEGGGPHITALLFVDNLSTRQRCLHNAAHSRRSKSRRCCVLHSSSTPAQQYYLYRQFVHYCCCSGIRSYDTRYNRYGRSLCFEHPTLRCVRQSIDHHSRGPGKHSHQGTCAVLSPSSLISTASTHETPRQSATKGEFILSRGF